MGSKKTRSHKPRLLAQNYTRRVYSSRSKLGGEVYTEMNPILITGMSGRLGRALRREFPNALTPSHRQLDIVEKRCVDRYLAKTRPATVIHAAAFTDVAAAERDHSGCWDVNVVGTENMVSGLQKSVPACLFVYVSTACVFSGQEGNYDEQGVPGPRNFYGLTKLIGEYISKRMTSYLIVRTNFIENAPWPHKRAFIDRFGTYLSTCDVARAIHELIEGGFRGVIHAAGDRRFSMYELASVTSPNVTTMTMDDTNLPLTVDMSLRSLRVAPWKMSLGLNRRNSLSQTSSPQFSDALGAKDD
jgi:dTDP-4-dehydrorhamnose reductase